jgi:hypothetical protein
LNKIYFITIFIYQTNKITTKNKVQNLKDIIRKSTVDEHNDFINIMSEGLHNKDPKVGIFWYNPKNNKLVDVITESLDCKDTINYKKFISENKPRGRVFYKDNKFLITVGSWINEDENYKAIDLVEKEFDLTNEDTEIVEDSHWDIGSGWENL